MLLTVLWSKLSAVAAIAGSIGGTSLALIAWILTCRYFYGTVNVTFLVDNYSSLAGSITSICSGALIAFVISMIKPDKYDFTGTRSSA